MKTHPLSFANSLAACFTACLALGGATAGAQTTQLNPAAARISDVAIQADMDAYKRMQGRIQKLNESGTRVRSYQLSKAQCWLDVSLHEYTRNDRSAFPQDALGESEKLIAGMERNVTPLPLDTPLVNGAAALRPDLWARAKDLKAHAGFSCAQQKTACAEVELVHAGNEFNQQQWRHAQPYVQMAEDQLNEAEQLAKGCAVPAVVPVPLAAVAPAAAVVAAPAPQRVAPAPAPAPAPVNVELLASAVFNFDRSGASDMRAFSAESLKSLADQTRSGNLKIDKVRLIGHADRLNGTRVRNYNEQLSRKRAETVRQFLVDAGLPAAMMNFEYLGDSKQVASCSGKFKSKAALQECLLPNRRVDVQVLGTRAR
jgi:OmpA-OmpF porin, OOP family